jgi:hypothetical protein
MRTQQLSLLEGEWTYYGVVSNFNLAEKKLQEVIEFHNKRGNAENFIREKKYGYDLKHKSQSRLRLVSDGGAQHPSLGIHPRKSITSALCKRHQNEVYPHPRKSRLSRQNIGFKSEFRIIKEVNRIREALELKAYSPIPNASS